MLDNQQIKNNWPKIKSLVLSHWNKLSEYEVEQTHGSGNSLGKLIEEAYGNKEDFDTEYERLCISAISSTPSSYKQTDPRKSSSSKTMDSLGSDEFDVAEKFMDKDRDEQYLLGPNGVTRPLQSKSMKDLTNKSVDDAGFNETDGYHNSDRHSKTFSGDPGHLLEEELLKPNLRGMNAEDAQSTPMREFTSEEKSKHKDTKHNKTNNKLTSDEFTPNQAPQSSIEDITLRGSNSSANTTSPSALTSSEATSKDTKKL